MGLQSKLGGVLVGSAVLLLTCGARGTQASANAFPGSFNAESAPGFTNTFSTNEMLSPKCLEAIAATPGSDPASKVLNGTLNNEASFQPGGTVHYTYLDNPDPNGGTPNFTIQDCVVTYPAGFFSATDFDPITGVLTNAEYDKQELVKGGTEIDGAALSGIRSSLGDIYFRLTAPGDLASGTWVCNFARDVRNGHGGGGNRKAPPACYQVPAPPSTTTTAATTTTEPATTTTTQAATTTTSGLVSATTVLAGADHLDDARAARVLGVQFTAPETPGSAPVVEPVGTTTLPRTVTSPRALLLAGAVALCLGVWLLRLSSRCSGRGAHRS